MIAAPTTAMRSASKQLRQTAKFVCIKIGKTSFIYALGIKKYKKEKKDVFKLNEGYKKFISDCKTERECVTETVRRAEAQGYVDLNQVIAVIEETKPDVVVIDSIQTMYDTEVASAPGSVTQVRECTMTLMRQAKNNNWKLTIDNKEFRYYQDALQLLIIEK